LEQYQIQQTFRILNNTRAGSGAVWIAYFPEEIKILTFTPLCNLDAELGTRESVESHEQPTFNFCCSGPEKCLMKTSADTSKHVRPICNKAIDVICGKPNPDFETNLVGLKYPTICMQCTNQKSDDISASERKSPVKSLFDQEQIICPITSHLRQRHASLNMELPISVLVDGVLLVSAPGNPPWWTKRIS